MIGAARYFAPRHFARRYWMKVGAAPAAITLFGNGLGTSVRYTGVGSW